MSLARIHNFAEFRLILVITGYDPLRRAQM
jgi:hypothetical protein